MKNKIYYLVIGTMMLSLTHAETYKPTQPGKMQRVHVISYRDTIFSNKILPGYHDDYLFRAQGQVNGSPFIQDISVYEISGEKRVAVGYISGDAARTVGYNGFKVGDRVTWEPQIDLQDPNKDRTEGQYFTGVIDMLDSDKCYIKIDCTKRIAVKLYEDIVKLHH